MMAIYANVIIDRSLEKLDRTLQYQIRYLPWYRILSVPYASPSALTGRTARSSHYSVVPRAEGAGTDRLNLFGSFATGNYLDRSDTDFYIVVDDEISDLPAVTTQAYQAIRNSKNKIEIRCLPWKYLPAVGTLKNRNFMKQSSADSVLWMDKK